ncbi:PD-(D/E)XK nuclease family protein [Okeania sp.]|uniref:PD-(D/E)XK nuclease family protein n=1 Tax=Okeania sp. TaxID=3100323 RepID=UPI002B4AB64B|nr:PD-(D/E)XK nuclease family protein [Okeania sp.]MEB3341033.1 PD-(D/E)XK nuclease family protein [Okeania sp.]
MVNYRLSQQHLNLLTNCPRKFQYLYLHNLGVPITSAEQERLNWGSQFHLLMQQKELGLPIESLILENQEMLLCFNNFSQAASEILSSETQDDIILRQAEHHRSFNFKGYILTAIYDLLIAKNKQAQIFDWKTYRYPKNQEKLAQNWQTRLYLYLLVETSKYLPEAVSMTYWFIQPKSEKLPYKLTFSYNQQAHKKTEQDLQKILDNLTDWLKNYQEKGLEFPQVQILDTCYTCQFSSPCQGFSEVYNREGEGVSTDISADLIFSLDNIPEIVI